MYASVMMFQIQPGQRDEFFRLAEEHLIPEVKQSKGQLAYVMTDPATDKVVVVAVYETEADARTVETSGKFGQLAARYIPHTIVPESVERHVYEVRIQAVADKAREMGV